MGYCAECADPPGGRICCEDGLTPFCIVQDGVAHSACRNLSRAASESPDQLLKEVLDVIVQFVGENYRADAARRITFSDGADTYESSDRRVKASATQVPLKRGSPGDLMPMS